MEHHSGIIAFKRCNNLEIYGNEVYDDGDQAVGIFLQSSSDDAVLYGEMKLTHNVYPLGNRFRISKRIKSTLPLHPQSSQIFA